MARRRGARERFGQPFVDKINEHPEYAVILDLRNYINDNLDEYLKNPRFFDESDYPISRYGPVEELGRPSLRKIPTYPYVPVAAK